MEVNSVIGYICQDHAYVGGTDCPYCEIATLKAKVAELERERDGYKNILEAINCTLQPMAKLVRDAIGMPGQTARDRVEKGGE